MLRDQDLLLVLNAMELQRWKMDEEQQSHEMWLTEESAMVLIKQEKAKARAAMEAAVGAGKHRYRSSTSRTAAHRCADHGHERGER